MNRRYWPSLQIKVQVLANGKKGDEIVAKTETLTLTLCRGCAFFNMKALAKALPDPSLQEGAQLYVQSKDYTALKAEAASEGGAIKLQLDGKAVALKLGEHFYLGSAEAAKAGALK